MEFKDYYAVLGLSKGATDAEIKKAYRKLARKHHPDLNPGDKAAEARFKEINEANEVLGDPNKRRTYDELGANWRSYEQTGPGAAPEGWNVNRGGAGFGDDDLSDFFHTFFGGAGFGGGATAGRRGRQSRPRRGRDLEHAVELTLEEAFAGTTRRIQVQQESQLRSVEVRIPPGVKEGSRVRAAGVGESSPGAESGDLFLVVHALPHPRFDRRGNDLHVRVAVPVTTAVLGGEMVVPALTGSTLRLKVPELTAAGRVFRLRGHGMPVLGKKDERGDLYATVDVQIPTQLSPEEKTLYEELKGLESGRAG